MKRTFKTHISNSTEEWTDRRSNVWINMNQVYAVVTVTEAFLLFLFKCPLSHLILLNEQNEMQVKQKTGREQHFVEL